MMGDRLIRYTRKFALMRVSGSLLGNTCSAHSFIVYSPSELLGNTSLIECERMRCEAAKYALVWSFERV